MATSVERFQVVGFIHTRKREGFRLDTAIKRVYRDNDKHRFELSENPGDGIFHKIVEDGELLTDFSIEQARKQRRSCYKSLIKTMTNANTSETVVVVVDMQNDFVHPNGALYSEKSSNPVYT